MNGILFIIWPSAKLYKKKKHPAFCSPIKKKTITHTYIVIVRLLSAHVFNWLASSQKFAQKGRNKNAFSNNNLITFKTLFKNSKHYLLYLQWAAKWLIVNYENSINFEIFGCKKKHRHNSVRQTTVDILHLNRQKREEKNEMENARRKMNKWERCNENIMIMTISYFKLRT